jgi:transposase InsO family protein
VRFGFIQTEKASYPVRLLCRVLDVSPAGFYAWCGRGPSERERQDATLRVAIRAAHAESRETYGSPRIHVELRTEERPVSRKRVARLMREEGLVPRRKRRFRTTTDSKHGHAVAPNLLAREFTANEPNERWVTDITYVLTREGWLYLAVILDLFSRRVIGWTADGRIDQGLAAEALRQALNTRNPALGLLHHSDRGVQYAANGYQRVLREHGIVCSMSRKGNCWDNAVAESFFATIKGELVDHEDYLTRDQARASIAEYIEVFYNCRRRHSALGYLSPVDYETAARRANVAA